MIKVTREIKVLQAMINSNPDTVTDFFVQLSRSLYGKMSDMMSSVKDTRTYGNLYDDLKLKNDYNDYTSKIADLEEKLKDYEDKWYSKALRENPPEGVEELRNLEAMRLDQMLTRVTADFYRPWPQPSPPPSCPPCPQAAVRYISC